MRPSINASPSCRQKFSNNILADEEGYVLYLTKDQLGGLSSSFGCGRGGRRNDRGHEGEYAITNTRSSMDPFLTFSEERDLREKVWRDLLLQGRQRR